MGMGTSKNKAEQVEDRAEDRLSSLPDEIITKILSHLNTKEVVRTVILSRQWKSNWKSVPDFELIDDEFILKGENRFVSYITDQNIRARFLNFVDRVLVANKSSRLEKIRIKSTAFVDSYVMELWLRSAIERHVNVLDVDFLRRWDDKPSVLTPPLFASNNLTVLKLNANMFLDIPTVTTSSSTLFPNLKILELCNVSYRDDFSLPNLLTNCPILEELHIVKPQWRKMGKLNITSHSVKRLLVKSTFDDREEAKYKVKTVVVDVPEVESIDISFDKQKYFVVTDMFSVEEAKLDLSDVFRVYLKKFLFWISHAKLLTLKPETTLSLLNAGSGNIPKFHNLTHLTLYGAYERAYTEHRKISDFTHWELMVEILKNSPKLETLRLENYSCRSEGYNRDLYTSTPHCFLWNLKTVEFNLYDYEISRYDQNMIGSFIHNARELKTMTIRSSSVSEWSIFICNTTAQIPERYLGSTITESETELILSFQ